MNENCLKEVFPFSLNRNKINDNKTLTVSKNPYTDNFMTICLKNSLVKCDTIETRD